MAELKRVVGVGKRTNEGEREKQQKKRERERKKEEKEEEGGRNYEAEAGNKEEEI